MKYKITCTPSDIEGTLVYIVEAGDKAEAIKKVYDGRATLESENFIVHRIPILDETDVEEIE